jgi:biotin operon repressor
VALALGRGLSREGIERDIRASEIRRALQVLQSDGLLANAAPTIRDVVATLLRAEQPLSQTEVADRTGRSTRSLRTHLPRLEALGLVEATAHGYRLRLSFCTDSERHTAVVPRLVDEDLLFARDVLYDAVALEDPPDRVWEVWTDLDPDGVPAVDDLLEHIEWVSWALPACQALAAQAAVAEASATTVRFGAELEHGQASLQQSMGGASA